MLLAVDTSVGTSVAIVDAAGLALAERSVTDTRAHAEVIGELIRDALGDAGASPGDLTAVAAGMGPGPFTGLRVGIAAARAFALGAEVPLIPVVSHDAIAWAWWRSHEPDDLVTVVTDARRREVYWSRYRRPAGLPVRIAGPELSRPENLPGDSGFRLEVSTVSAAALGAVALTNERAGIAVPDYPLYLRSPDVTLSPKQVRG